MIMSFRSILICLQHAILAKTGIFHRAHFITGDIAVSPIAWSHDWFS
jgi:hypothetical protein